VSQSLYWQHKVAVIEWASSCFLVSSSPTLAVYKYALFNFTHPLSGADPSTKLPSNMDYQYVLTIDKAIYKVFRIDMIGEIVPPRGNSPPHLPQYMDGAVSSLDYSYPDSDYDVTSATSGQVLEYPEPDYENKLLFLHCRIVGDLYLNPVKKNLTYFLTGPFRWARRIHTERNMTYMVSDDHWTSFWCRRLWYVLCTLALGSRLQISD